MTNMWKWITDFGKLRWREVIAIAVGLAILELLVSSGFDAVAGWIS
jgi:hypothetical protein